MHRELVRERRAILAQAGDMIGHVKAQGRTHLNEAQQRFVDHRLARVKEIDRERRNLAGLSSDREILESQIQSLMYQVEGVGCDDLFKSLSHLRAMYAEPGEYRIDAAHSTCLRALFELEDIKATI
jgi:hypothetical protein